VTQIKVAGNITLGEKVISVRDGAIILLYCPVTGYALTITTMNNREINKGSSCSFSVEASVSEKNRNHLFCRGRD
jgi:hypothetical protein